MIAVEAPYSRCKSAKKEIALRVSAVGALQERRRDAVTSCGTPYSLRASAVDDRGVHNASSVRVRGASAAS